MQIPAVFCFGAALLLGRFAAVAQPSGSVMVRTEAGQVRGQQQPGVVVFRSIPYAGPPVGALRFAAPAPHQPWPGVRDARRAGPTAPFSRPSAGPMNDYPVFGPGWVKGDDYLTTSIWTPAVAGPLRPVMVYLHGGAFVVGTSNVPLFDGTQFAKQGVVLITLNYRMGIE